MSSVFPDRVFRWRLNCARKGVCATAKRPIAIALLGMFGVLLAGCDQTETVERIHDVPWALTGAALVVDTHTHTQFSDGQWSVAELVEHAAAQGCQGVAITDHSDAAENAATPAYFSEIDQARIQFPSMILVGGMEWNVSGYKRREHVAILAAPEVERALLDGLRFPHGSINAKLADAFAWIRAQARSESDFVMIYNHPSRDHTDVGASSTLWQQWHAAAQQPLLIEGGPGHQKLDPAQVYRKQLPTVDRWDPMVDTGGGWDRLLDAGHEVWAAIASSDYHAPKRDFQPCEFARTHVQVPDRSARGLLTGLKAGSFWADHGHLLNDFALLVSTKGLDLPLVPGESARLPEMSGVKVTVAIERGRNGLGQPLHVELIGNCEHGEPQQLRTATLGPAENQVSWGFPVLTAGADQKSCYFRARVRQSIEGGPDLLAYGNPVRLVLR